MTMNITSKQMDITPAIRTFVEEKLARLDKWRAHLINPHIVLSKQPDGFMAEATISVNGTPLVASSKHEDMYNAISEMVTKLERQLNKQQHKPNARRAYESIRDLEVTPS